MTDSDDSLLQGWYGAAFRRKRYYRWSERWDHDHCEFCWRTFVASAGEEPLPGTLNEGYAQVAHGRFPDDYDWVCAECFDRLHEKAGWNVVN